MMIEPVRTRVIESTEVLVQGDGEITIVMVHGWPDTWRLWDAQVDAFATDYRCVRFTLPGFDRTHRRRARSLRELVQLIASVVDATSPDRPVILMVHDWGCLFGYQYAMQHPRRVSRLIGVDIGDAGSTEHLKALSAAQKCAILAYQLWLAAAWCIAGRLGDVMTRWMARRLRARSDQNEIGSQMNYPYFIQWTGAHEGYRDARPFMPGCPMLFLYGTRKQFQFHSRQWAERVAQSPGCRVLGLPTGHWVMRQDSDAFNAAVDDWLRANR